MFKLVLSTTSKHIGTSIFRGTHFSFTHNLLDNLQKEKKATAGGKMWICTLDQVVSHVAQMTAFVPTFTSADIQAVEVVQHGP